MNAIEVEHISKTYIRDGRETLAMQDVSLDIAEGEFCVIIGPSGCGKSTLLNMVSGLDKPSQGSLLYFDKPVTGINTTVGYLTQDDTLLPWADVFTNVALPLTLSTRRENKAARRSKVEELIHVVGLDGFENHYPHQLSGGMRRRVALARTLVYGPKVLLMDEPFGALDAQLKQAMQNELLRICAEQRRTVVFITHDLDEALVLGDRIVVMSARPGHIVDDVTVDIPRPRDAFNARFHPEFQVLYKRLLDHLHHDPDESRELADA
jgi:NitT/TauT family transport system ATP-binding protein